MAKSRYSDYSPKQLLEKIKQLEKKRYGLVWEDKVEEVAERCERELPVLVHQPDKEISEDKDGPTNLWVGCTERRSHFRTSGGVADRTKKKPRRSLEEAF
ncbi:MAG: hypothetical protein ACR2M8_10235 [Pyrinomonadaceae bacterium]|nr:hypothetical protein [Acidobacteriota bacterium]